MNKIFKIWKCSWLVLILVLVFHSGIAQTIIISNDNVDENVPTNTLVGILSEEGGATLTYTIELQPTPPVFELVNGDELHITTSPDYETDQSYDVTINGKIGLTTVTQIFTISINDVNEAPTITSGDTDAIDEDISIGGNFYLIKASDPESLSSSLTFELFDGISPNNNDMFQIDGDNLIVAAQPDFETQSSLTVYIRAYDGALYSQPFELTITVNDIDEAPFIDVPDQISIDENQSDITILTNISVTDPETGSNPPLSFDNSVDPNHGNANFELMGNDLNLVNAYNYEVDAVDTIYLTATDGSLVTIKPIIIQVNDLNDLPTVTSPAQIQLVENASPAGPVYSFIVEDEDAGDTYSIAFSDHVTPNANSNFQLMGDDLQLIEPMNFELGAIQKVGVTIIDENLAELNWELEIQVENVEEAPTDILLSINTIFANQGIGEIATIVGVDEDAGDLHTFTLINDPATDNDKFFISGNKLHALESFAIGQDLVLLIRVTDSTGKSFDKTFYFTVKRFNNQPTGINLSNDILVSGQQPGEVAKLTTEDADTDEIYIYSLVNGVGSQDNDRFTIDADVLLINEVVNLAQKSQYNIRLLTEDQNGGALQKDFVLKVYDDNVPPQIQVDVSSPATTNIDASTITLVYSVTDNYLVDESSVILWYRENTGSSDSWLATEPVAQNAEKFTFQLPTINLSSLGIEHYLEAADKAANNTQSAPKVLPISFQDSNSPRIEGLTTGTGQINDYQIFAIPYELEDKRVQSVFDEYPLNYNGIDWRLFHYDNSTQTLTEYQTDFTELRQGKGYWLNTKHNTSVAIGAGNTPKKSQSDPFEIQLSQGWNQIGNPYDIDVPWQEIVDFNGAPENLGPLRLFRNGSFINGSKLGRFEGGFVHWSGNENFVLRIPLEKVSTGGRLEKPQEDFQLLVNFQLSNSSVTNKLGGFGTHLNATDAKDKYDQVKLPMFFNYLDINFDSPGEYPLSRSIVNPKEINMWDFSIASNMNEEQILSWNIILDQTKAEVLLLINKSTGETIDMYSTNSIKIFSKESEWRVLYGPLDRVEQLVVDEKFHFVSEPFPNPFTTSTALEFNSFGEKQILLRVLDLQGRQVLLQNLTLEEGETLISWDGKDNNQHPVKNGMYILKVELTANGTTSVIFKRILKK